MYILKLGLCFEEGEDEAIQLRGKLQAVDAQEVEKLPEVEANAYPLAQPFQRDGEDGLLASPLLHQLD